MVPFIIKALQKSESVCVNDLGTFALHYVPARIEGKTIKAPHNEVTLDTNIEHDEIAFTNLVSLEKKCQITQANNDIIAWVDELKYALQNNKSVTFEGFGTFSLSDKGKLSFLCDYIPELNQEFEGMTDITPGVIPTVIDEEPEAEPIEEAAPFEDQKLIEEPIPVIAPVVVPEPIEEPAPAEEPEVEPVIQRSSLLEDDKDDKDDKDEVVEDKEEDKGDEKDEKDEEPVIQRSTLLEDEEAPTEVVEEPVPTEGPAYVAEPVTEPVAEPEPEEEPVIQRSTLLEDDKDEKEEVDDNNSEDEVDDDEKPRKKRSLWWLWLLLTLLLLGVLGFCGYQFRDKVVPVIEQVKSKFKKTEQVEQKEETTDDNTIEYQEEVQEAEEVVEEAPEPYQPEVIKSTADNKYEYIHFESGHYYVIAGSLPNESDAELHIRQRGLDKYNPTLLLQDGVSNIRVCIGIYDTEEEAESFAKSVNSKYWVLK